MAYPPLVVFPGPPPPPVARPIDCSENFPKELLSIRLAIDPAMMGSPRIIPIAISDHHLWLDIYTQKLWKDVDLFQAVKNRVLGVPNLDDWYPSQRKFTIQEFWAGRVELKIFNQVLKHRQEPVICGKRTYMLSNAYYNNATLLVDSWYLGEQSGYVVKFPAEHAIVYKFPEWVVKGTGEKFQLGLQHEGFLSYGVQKVQTAQGQGIVELRAPPCTNRYNKFHLATLDTVKVLYADGRHVSTKVNQIQKVVSCKLVRVLKNFEEWYRRDKNIAVKSQHVSLELLRKFFNPKGHFLMEFDKLTSEDSASDDLDYDPTSDCAPIKTRFPPKYFVILIDRYDIKCVQSLIIAGYQIIWLVDSSVKDDCIPKSFDLYQGRESEGLNTEKLLLQEAIISLQLSEVDDETQTAEGKAMASVIEGDDCGSTSGREADTNSNDGGWDQVDLSDGEGETCVTPSEMEKA